MFTKGPSKSKIERFRENAEQEREGTPARALKAPTAPMPTITTPRVGSLLM